MKNGFALYHLINLACQTLNFVFLIAENTSTFGVAVSSSVIGGIILILLISFLSKYFHFVEMLYIGEKYK